MDLIVKKTTEQKAALEKLNPAQKEDQVIIAEKAQTIQQLDVEQKKNKQTLTEIEQLQKKLTKAMSEESIETERLRQQISEQNKANRDLVSSEKIVKGSLVDLEQQLAKLKKAWRESGSAHGASTKEIDALDKKVKQLNSTIGNNQRNVGGYKDAILDAAKQIPYLGKVINVLTTNVDNSTHSITENINESSGLNKNSKILGFGLAALGGIAAGVVVMFNKLKEAFVSTVSGMNLLNTVSAATKQGFYDLVTTGSLSIKKMQEAAEAAKLMNEIRAGDRRDLVEFAALNRQISKLEYEAADKTKTREVRQVALNKAIAKQNELSDKKILDAKEELAAVEKVLDQQPENEAALNKQAELIARIIGLDTERFDLSKRNQGKLTAFEKEEADRVKKQYDDLMKVADEQIEMDKEAATKKREQEDKDQLAGNKHYVELTKQREEEKKQIVSDASKETAFIVEGNLNVLADKQKALNDSQLSGFELLQRSMVDVNKQTGEQMTEANQKVAENKKAIDEKAKEDSIAIEQAKIQAINDISMAALDFASTLIESAKQRELEAAGDNAEKKAKIEKEYAKKEKAMALSKAVISGALAILNAMNTQPFLPLGPIMAAVASTMASIQVSIIAATKFAEGGEVGGKLHSQGGTLIEAEKDEFIIKRKSASKYKGLLRAINDDDPMRIAEELRNKKFHTVWGGVQETLSNVSRQDPYTRLMYEEMRNKPFSYQDSDGNTVIVQNNIKRVIKKR